MIDGHRAYLPTAHEFRSAPVRLMGAVLAAIGTVTYSRMRGSRASLRPSPTKLIAMTVTRIIRPGKIATHGAWIMSPWARNSMLPQLAVGGWTPSPRKLADASRMMAWPTPRVAATMTGANVFGRTWRKMIATS